VTRPLAQPAKSFHRDLLEIVDRRQARILGSFLTSVSLATIPVTAELKWLGANVSEQVKSHARHLPFDNGMKGKPSFCHHVGTATFARAVTVFLPARERV
jgi:hypothetical protein